MTILSDKFHGIYSFILLVSATALNLSSGSSSSQLQNLNTIPAPLPEPLFQHHLPFPCLKWDITPSLHLNTLLSVVQCCSTCGLTKDYRITWGACKKNKDSWAMLALTNPRMSRVRAKGLYVSQEPQMLIHYSLKSSVQTFSQVCSFHLIPVSQKKLVRYDSTVTKSPS